ncbi:MAG: hypothetical protein ACI9SB_000085, partial [Candidatus Azotimanducaceae bacterium]
MRDYTSLVQKKNLPQFIALRNPNSALTMDYCVDRTIATTLTPTKKHSSIS